MIGKIFSKAILLSSLALACAGSASSAAHAQAVSSSSAVSGVSAAPNTLGGESREYQGLAVEGWMLAPTMLVGATFDDNIFQSTYYRRSARGLHLRPAISAVRDAGIHKTAIDAVGDLRLYPDNSNANLVNARAQISHVWEARRDLVFRGTADYARVTDMYNSGLVLGPGRFGVFAAPQRYNTFGGSISGTKSIDRTFVSLGGDVHVTNYDTLYTSGGAFSQGYRNSVIPSVTGRLGYNVTPLLYAYAEGTGNFREFENSFYNSRGFRTVAGLGTDRISLFRGEVFAGYQRQFYGNFLFGSPQSPAVGGRLYWYPTRAITVGVLVDETFTDSGLTVVGNSTGSPARVTSSGVTIDYAMSRQWKASVRGGFDDLLYLYGGRHDHRWRAGARLDYEVLRNLDATFEYSFVSVVSNILGGSFTRNQFTVGGTYKY